MKVSVIIPHYNDLQALDKCLAALEGQTFPAQDREVIVADNASPQGETAVEVVVAGRAKLTIVMEKGAGPARNGGVAIAQGQAFAFIDSDCLPKPDWLAQGMAALSQYDFVGGAVEVSVSNPQHLTPAEAFERVFAFDMRSYVLKKQFAGAGNLFCPRFVFDAVGGFGNGVSEDVDWSHRAIAKGFRLGYSAQALVSHPARASWQELKRKWMRTNAETHALTMRKRHGRLKWILRSLVLPASAVVHTVKVLRSSRIHGMRARLGALGVLYRLRFWRMSDSFHLLLGKS